MSHSPDPAVRALLARAGHTAPPIHWERQTWASMNALRERSEGLALLPVGAIEQHGPHLPLNTDSAIATAVCLYASALSGAPVMPVISYANSLGHTDQWPGTLSSTPLGLITLLRDIAHWYVRAGWSRLLLLNAHYGNDAPLRCAMDHIRTEYQGRLSVGLKNSWDLSAGARAFYLQDGADIHANRAETSLMLALDPEAVSDHLGVDDPDRTDGCQFTWTVAQTSTNGVTGRPSEASAEEGARMLAVMGEDLATAVAAARGEQPPLAQPTGPR